MNDINNIKTSTLEFVLRIACVVPADRQTVITIMAGLNLFGYQEFVEELQVITQQAYNGYNQETGDWCKELLKAVIDEQYS